MEIIISQSSCIKVVFKHKLNEAYYPSTSFSTPDMINWSLARFIDHRSPISRAILSSDCTNRRCEDNPSHRFRFQARVEEI